MDDQLELHLPAPPASGETPLIPARMVNEFVYCPRLAYLMWTQGEWLDGVPQRQRCALAGSSDRSEQLCEVFLQM